ncbi:MAG TPA: hypothetical protein DCY85_06670 [Firmicutes bacterium]|nr:hypothetical protein [Bacillota bacterium]
MDLPCAAEDDVPDYTIDYGEAEDEDEKPIAKEPTNRLKNKKDHIGKIKTPVSLAKPDFITATFGTRTPIAKDNSQKEEKPKVDVSGVAVGVLVYHKKFGDGKVVELDDKYITVSFGKAEKRFLFPGSFENDYLARK